MLPAVSAFVRFQFFEFELQLRPYEYECQLPILFTAA